MDKVKKLSQVEMDTILGALYAHNGNRTTTAKALGIGIRTLQRKLIQYGVNNPNAERKNKNGTTKEK